MATPPVLIGAAPDVPNSGTPETTFDQRYEAFNAWEKNELQPKANAQAQGVYDNAVLAEAGAATATTKADDAQAAAAAAALWAASAINAPGTKATSNTNLTLTAGAKAWTIQAGKLFPPGQPIFLASAADASKRMSGILLTHDPATGACTANLTPDPGAVGTYADWVMGIGVPPPASVMSMPRVTRTGNIALTVGDRGKLIDITSGTFAQTTDAAGTLGADWVAWLTNTGTGAPTWNGITLTQGAIWLLHSDGATVRGYPFRLPEQIMVAREEQISGSSGGTPPATGAWFTRTLNAVQANGIAGASLASNQVTLPPGTYLAEGSAPGCRTGGHQARLYNVTAAATLLAGSPEINSSTEYNQTRSFFRGQFTLAATSVVRVEHHVQSAPGHGLGYPYSSGVANVFAEITFRRIGP
ncbi:MAG: hypothetical protein ACO1PM_08070 [Acidovorax sp.]